MTRPRPLRASAEAALVVLAEGTGSLLATSICGHGLFAGNPWSIGISGGFASPAADELIAESDLIIAFGASLTQWTTKRGKLIAAGAVLAQVDVEAAKLGYRRRGYAIDIVQFPDTDFAAIARGHGSRAATVRTLDDLERVQSWVREGALGVFVIDAKINPDLEADWHAEHFP